MDLDFTEEQDLLRDTVRGLCGQYASMETVRSSEEDANGFPADLWKQLGELDLIGLSLPAEYGGSGQSLLEAAIVYEEFGRALAPSPHFVSAVMASGVLVRAGSAEQKATWLPKIASGEVIVSVAWLEPEHGFGPEGVDLRANSEGDTFVLTGEKFLVPFANVADSIIVLARTGEAAEDVDLFMVDPSADGVSLEKERTMASDNVHAMRLEGVKVTSSGRIGDAGTGWATWDSTMYEGAILQAAQAIGGSEQVIAITSEYAMNREQFDKPLASFQAISHYMADRDTETEGARTLVYEAAWAKSAGRSVDRLAPMAKYQACRAFVDSTKTALQIWGGMGFTLEADVQLYFRRAKALQLTWWDDRHCEELIAADVLD